MMREPPFSLLPKPAPMPLKGKTKPMRIYAVIGEKGGPRLGKP